MDVNIKGVKTRKDLKKFIFLPEKLHANRPNWVPPIYLDEWKYFNSIREEKILIINRNWIIFNKLMRNRKKLSLIFI